MMTELSEALRERDAWKARAESRKRNFYELRERSGSEIREARREIEALREQVAVLKQGRDAAVELLATAKTYLVASES